METRQSLGRVMCLLSALGALAACSGTTDKPGVPGLYTVQEQFVDANGVLIYVKSFGQGDPLVVLHGGPGASHDYFLPYLLPLARHNRLVFIDERGSGRSEKLEDVSKYTVEAMAEDVEAVRQALGLGRINLLGHSCGGVLAQAYALKHQANLQHLLLCSTFHSTKALNDVFRSMKAKMSPVGNARLRKALWMPVLTAVRYNPWLRDYYQRLRARGKHPKVALTAAMRKLLTAIYSVAKHQRPFTPPPTRSETGPRPPST